MKPALYLPLVLLMVACSNSLSIDYDVETEGRTHIAFELAEDSHVLIWLENSYHTNIKTVIDEELPQGIHAINLIMEDEDGNKFPPGIYNVHINTKNHNKSTTLLFAPNSSRP